MMGDCCDEIKSNQSFGLHSKLEMEGRTRLPVPVSVSVSPLELICTAAGLLIAKGLCSSTVTLTSSAVTKMIPCRMSPTGNYFINILHGFYI